MRYFFHIGYNGLAYNGWQRLPGIKSVQEVLEVTISKVIKKAVTINGCGRTDAKVHATQFFFHLDIIDDPGEELMFRLNKNLPSDIAVYDILPMEGQPHARLDAIQRTYAYFIHTYKDPFLDGVSALYEGQSLNLERMAEAVALLTKYNDYKAFCRNSSNSRTTLCHVNAADLFVNAGGDRLMFTISANRFLQGMVRIIVNKLLDIARGKISVENFEHYLISKESTQPMPPAYPQGLHLSHVIYPFLDLPPKTRLFDQIKNDSKTWRKVVSL